MASLPNLLPEEFLEDSARLHNLSSQQLYILKLLFSKGLTIKQIASKLGSVKKENAVSKQLSKVYVRYGITEGSSKGKKAILRKQLCESFFSWRDRQEAKRRFLSSDMVIDEIFTSHDLGNEDLRYIHPELARLSEVLDKSERLSEKDIEEFLNLVRQIIEISSRRAPDKATLLVSSYIANMSRIIDD